MEHAKRKAANTNVPVYHLIQLRTNLSLWIEKEWAHQNIFFLAGTMFKKASLKFDVNRLQPMF